MKITDWSEKAAQFIKINSNLPRIESNVIINIIETYDGPLRIMIDVGEDTTVSELRKAIPIAIKWRDNLLKYQGRTGLYSDNYLLVCINKDLSGEHFFTIKGQAIGFTYQDVAQAINSLVMEWLCESRGNKYKTAPSNYRKMLNHHLWGIEDRIPNYVERCYKLLRLFRFNEKQASDIIEECLTIIDGQEEYPNDYPVSRNKVISTMQWFRGNK